MFIITHAKENSIWTTETPFQKSSGIWHFYDSKEEYEIALEQFKDKYSSKFLMTLNKIQQLKRDIKRTEDDE